MRTILVTIACCYALQCAAEEKTGETRAQCAKNMRQIYEAIQSYRIEHKDLPPFLYSLVPKHIAAGVPFRCPAAAGRPHRFAHLKDPKIESDYLYEFSAAEAGGLLGGGKTTMAEMKMLQMALAGGGVPILRCHFHDPVLNISYDGDVFDSPLNWEDLHRSKIPFEELQPMRIRAKMLRSLGGGAADEIAFEQIREATTQAPGREASQRAMAAHEKITDFLRMYPASRRVPEARQLQHRMLFTAARSGNEQAKVTLQDFATKALQDSTLSEDQAFELNMMAANLEASQRGPAYLDRIRELTRNFPARYEAYHLLLNATDQRNEEELRETLDAILKSGEAPDQAKELAKSHLRRIELKGKPAEIAFTALDGRKVDLSAMQGKVVLVDFWATWCAPCVAELPKLQALYDRLHPKGFEIVGISFDNNRSALETFIKRRDIRWPQHFDGKGWQNEIGKQYAISSIPTMWLIGKDGKVTDLNAREDLHAKVEAQLQQ